MIAIPVSGVAVLNADDPRVLGMAADTPARVVTFGTTPNADVHVASPVAEDSKTVGFTVEHDGERVAGTAFDD